jgi:hypothetical protein
MIDFVILQCIGDILYTCVADLIIFKIQSCQSLYIVLITIEMWRISRKSHLLCYFAMHWLYIARLDRRSDYVQCPMLLESMDDNENLFNKERKITNFVNLQSIAQILCALNTDFIRFKTQCCESLYRMIMVKYNKWAENMMYCVTL